MRSATRPVLQDLINELIIKLCPTTSEAQDIMDCLVCQLKFRYGDETADVQHEAAQLRQALDELELTQSEVERV